MEFGKELLAYMTFLAMVVPLVVQAIKKTGVIPKKWLPIASIVLGVGLGLLALGLPGAGSAYVMAWAGGLAGAGGTGVFEIFTNREKKYSKEDE
ncbi:holin [Listeria weihenstephanensis FSL R9-0317]|uniref:Holin n=1 Tax=Listeria weihenstephanensis TaxID=1006155 RepID=A0A1S7FST3_9LIST|nr:holin [Listeria weihenstephanensis]AQY50518.1 holin [Listeria phage LWP01] [Listeria weihenstephanensis]AQY52664.1 holin [Listeria phage LWP01]EUJ41538.1 holin [Listeria weihenstephanensis FSL R9-0317]